MDESDQVAETVLFNQDEIELVKRAREAMYGKDSENVRLSHAISLLALEEIHRSERQEIEEEKMFEGVEETPISPETNQETPR